MNPFTLKLKDSVVPNSPVDPEDTLNLKNALMITGNMPKPPWGITDMPDGPMYDAISRFQKENNLIRDDMMKPGGETEKAINQQLSQIAGPQLASYGPREDPKFLDKEAECLALDDAQKEAEKKFKRTKDPADRAHWLELANQLGACRIELGPSKGSKPRKPKFPEPPRRR